MDTGAQKAKLDTGLRQYQALFEAAESIVTHRDLSSLLQDLRERLQQVVQFDTVNVVLHNPKSNMMRRHVLDEFASPDRLITELPIEEVPSGWVWQTQQPMLINDLGAYQSRYPEVVAELHEYRIKTFYLLPLTSLGRRLGAISFGSLREAAWNEADQKLLQQVAKLVAIAVDNAVNSETAAAAEVELNLRLDHLRLMLKITNEVVAQLDLRQLLLVISSSIREVMGNDYGGVALFDHQAGQLISFMTDTPPGQPLREAGYVIPLEGSPGGLAYTSGQPVFLDKPDFERFPSGVFRQFSEEGFRSGGAIPLIAHGSKLGVLRIASKRAHAFSDHDKELMCQVANQVAIAVDNALNFERARTAEKQSKQQSDRLEILLRINNAVVSQLDLRQLLRVIFDCFRGVVHHDAGGLLLYEEDSNKLRMWMTDLPSMGPIAEERDLIPLEGSQVGLAFASGQPLFCERFDMDRFPSAFTKRAYESGIRSTGNIPLIAHGRKLGILSIGRRREGAFSGEDIELLCQSANQIAIAVENALAFREIETLKNKLASEKLYLEDEIRTEHNFEELIGESPAFKRILKQVETVAATDSSVLIRGETGTGKELLARAIHNLSPRRERTLVKVNCSAIPTGLLESELFGHERGAFTGAITQRIGRFELAHRGTLFLDEVGDIALELQPKLLRVLQEQEFERLGSTRTQKVDVRLIAATNCELEEMVADKKYRSDLYYRLNVFPITIPPLRDRREDIPLLARFFTQKHSRRLKKQITSISAETMTALTRYGWPGNIRELEHFIERAVILTRGSELEVSLADLKSSESTPPAELATLDDAERDHILRALKESNWVVGGSGGAAARLGMKRTTLQARMQKLGISRQ